MFTLIRNLSSPLLSFIALTVASSFMGTFLGVQTKAFTQDEWIIGSMTSCTYIGIVLGAFGLEPLVARIGHIRTFCIFASLMAIVSLLHSLYFTPVFWMLLRFISGISLAGLYIVIESWLLSSSSAENRGKALSIYMAALYTSQSTGQLLLELDTQSATVSFILVAILCSLSILPVSLTKRPSPTVPTVSLLRLSTLYKISPTGVLGCFLAGIIMGSIYGLTHSYIADIGRMDDLAFVMATIIIGGALLQYPVGVFADRFDKRKVLMFSLMLVITSSLVILLLEKNSTLWGLDYVSFFIFGGCCFSLYPLSTALACENIESEFLLGAIGGLLLSYGVGATVGPIISPLFIDFLGPSGLFVFFIAIASFLSIVCIYRSFTNPFKSLKNQQCYVPRVQTTPIANNFISSLKKDS